MTTAYGERINIQQKPHVYRKKYCRVCFLAVDTNFFVPISFNMDSLIYEIVF